MPGRRSERARPAAPWTRQKMLALLIGAGLTAVLLVGGLVLAVVDAAQPARHPAGGAGSADSGRSGGQGGGVSSVGPPARGATAAAERDALAARPMPTVPADAAQPGPVSLRDPGAPIMLPAATRTGPAGVPTGFGPTRVGALAQLAAIDQAALQSGALSGARGVITGWALPGGPTTTNWSGVAALATLLNAAGLSGGGSGQLAIVVTPLMGQVKGSVGRDFVLPCVDFEVDVTLQQTARAAAADCQRMVWTGDLWMIGPGVEPAEAPSVWPDTDTAIGVGWRDLRRG